MAPKTSKATVTRSEGLDTCGTCGFPITAGATMIQVGRERTYHPSVKCCPADVSEVLGGLLSPAPAPASSTPASPALSSNADAAATIQAAIVGALGDLGSGGAQAKVDAALERLKQETAESLQGWVAKLEEAAKGTRPVEVTVQSREPFEPRVVQGRHHPMFEHLLQALGLRQRVYLAGPAGSGKTHAAEASAEALGMPMFLQGPVSDAFQLLGYVDASGTYQATPLYRWATHRGPALLVLDEVDASNANALLSLNAALANGWAVFPHEQVKIDADKLVVANGNTMLSGATAGYAGRQRQDGALVNRFTTTIPWDIDEAFEFELAAGRGADVHQQTIGHRVRAALSKYGIDAHWGPRDTLAYVDRRVQAGASHEDALRFSCLARLSEDQRAKVLEAI